MSFEKIDESVYVNNTVFRHESTYGRNDLRLHEHTAYHAQGVRFAIGSGEGDVSDIKPGYLIETDGFQPFMGLVDYVLKNEIQGSPTTISIFLKEPWQTKDNCLSRPTSRTGFRVNKYTTISQEFSISKPDRLQEYQFTGDLYEFDKMSTKKAFLFKLDGEEFEIGVVELRNLFRKEFNKGETK